MPLHHKTLESAVNKYGHLAGKATELIAALKADEKGYDDEAVNEIFTAITHPKVGDELPPVKEPPLSPTSPKTPMPLFDKWRGEWKATKAIRDARGEQFVTEWTFIRTDQKPNKTNIPMAQHQADLFNNTRRTPVGKIPTEQLFPAGDIKDIVWRPVNPNEEFKL